MTKVPCPRCDGKGKIDAEAVSVDDLILAHRKAKGLTQIELAPPRHDQAGEGKS